MPISSPGRSWRRSAATGLAAGLTSRWIGRSRYAGFLYGGSHSHSRDRGGTPHFLIAEVDGRPAAALCALRVGGSGKDARSAIVEVVNAAELDATEQSAIWQRGAYATKCWTPGADDNWLIEHVAARPSHRGQGLALALLDHALTAGRAAGYTRASIVFYIGNDVAERCYARAGFTFAAEKRDPEFETLTGAPGFRRFERAI
jgi:GNAT superfamily N-acetyltransferase